MSGGKRSRRKGDRAEAKARKHGFERRRVPLSGATGVWGGGDLIIGSRTFEVKARARGISQLYRWLGDRHFGVILAADSEEPLLVLRLGGFLRECAFRTSSENKRPKTIDGLSGAAPGPGRT